MALVDVLPALVCPRCRQPLTLADPRSVRCGQGHAFDVARQGYLNLLATAPPGNADTGTMVAARERFLAAGHFDGLATALARLAAVGSTPDPAPRRTVLEVGAGTGHYLSALLRDAPGTVGLALDVSVPAARRAARSHPRVGSVVADVWQPLPVADATVDVLLDVFAPRNPDEFRRVLRDDGLLLIATPAPEHLAELRTAAALLTVPEDKEVRLQATLGGRFRRTSTERVSYPLELDRDALHDLVAMGPNAFHLDADDVAGRLHTVPDPLRVTVAVAVTSWQPR